MIHAHPRGSGLQGRLGSSYCSWRWPPAWPGTLSWVFQREGQCWGTWGRELTTPAERGPQQAPCGGEAAVTWAAGA